MLPPLTPVLAWDAVLHLTEPDSISSANQALKSSALTPSKASKYQGLAPPAPKLPQISGNQPYLSSVRWPPPFQLPVVASSIELSICFLSICL